MWPLVKILTGETIVGTQLSPEMTYNVSSGTLNLTIP